MRDIKFRAWNKKHNEMWEVTSMSWVIPRSYDEPERDMSDTVQSIGAGNKDSTNELHPDNTLMQYTGLKDKNGVEIYEGDIVRRLETDWMSQPNDDTRSPEEYLNGLAYVGSVIFLNTEWYIDGCGDFNVGQHSFIEVIGNIYENLELLKENK